MGKRSIQRKLYCVLQISLFACFITLNIGFALATYFFYIEWRDMTIERI